MAGYTHQINDHSSRRFFFKYLSTQRITTDSKMENSWKGKIHTIYKRLWRKQKSRIGIHTRLRSRSWPKASCGGISSWSRRKQLAARSGESPLGWTVKCLRPCVVLYADGSSMELSYAVRVNKAMNSSLGNSSPGREQRDFNCPSQLILTFNYLKRRRGGYIKSSWSLQNDDFIELLNVTGREKTEV